ncbi:MAG: hypothetical protein RLZZ574_1655, partial [Cyanobacteriota bacterium]
MNIQESRQLAMDENTEPNILRQLANSTDLITRKNIVTNPNIPPDILSKLAVEFPKQVFDNPAIDLLLLETPDLFSGALTNIFCSLLKREVPDRMIEYAANSTNEKLKLAILMNPQTPQQIVDWLAKSDNKEISEAAQIHINSTRDIGNNYKQFVAQKIEKTLEPSDRYAEFEIAFNKLRNYRDFFHGMSPSLEQKIIDYSSKTYFQPSSLSNEEIDKLTNLKSTQDIFKNQNYILEVATNPNTPLTILEKIADLDKYGLTHLALAKNYNISLKILEKIIDKRFINSNYSKTDRRVYQDRKIYREIISNSATPIKIFEMLANHPSD